MKSRRLRSLLMVLVLLAMTSQLVFAEDGILFRRDISKTPDAETEKAGIFMMDFYVPAQASTGLVGPVIYPTLVDGTTVAYEDRDYAKPLISVYIDDIGAMIDEEEIAAMGGIALGAFDAFVGVSLDDGTSWRTTNLSRSSDLTSFTLENGHEYKGGVHNVVHQVFNDNIFVAWVSKYCDGGTPLYKLDVVENAEYFADLEENYGKDALYLYDLFGVKGNQASVDYTEEGYPEVGEIPFSCVWTARGKLLAGDDPATPEVEATYVTWTKPERLTSGGRDANLPAVDCAKGAGCIMTWQEDPEGLRPGQGLGPGEGWSGAVANGKTDIWYSYISFKDFDLVFADDTMDTTTELTLEAYAEAGGTTLPKPYVPMAMPTRLTDNNMCKSTKSDPYCYIDFDTLDTWDHTNVVDNLAALVPTPESDYCAETFSWTTPGGSTLTVCKTEDGRVLNGRVASTRVRLNLKPYTTDVDVDGDGNLDKSAWVIMAAEESKALGDQLVDPYGNPTEEPIDIGKDVWYYSFDMFNHPIIDQGGMLNQPAKCSPWTVGATYDCADYEFFPVQIDPLNGGDYYLTEIARRFALTTNSVNAVKSSTYGLSAMLIYKQGIINQGGPADIMLRRVVVDPATFDPAVDNPYAYENMECDEWVDADGSNPNYLKGLCLSPAINITGNTIVECTGGTGNDACAATFPVADDGSIPDGDAAFPKVLEWRQCNGESTTVGGVAGCETDNDLDDQTWENPFDVAKGHRGFLDGDFVMMMYAWSPNWKANSVGNDHYNLYTRRSFDGGLTWVTTPAALGGLGTTASENFCVTTPSAECEGTTFTYAAGEFEQGRNVSQLIGNKITILDPRYSPTGGMKLYSTIGTGWLTDHEFSFEGLPYEDDAVRDPSKFFMVYETGDNTTVDVGEAVPLDLYYSRATVYGDVWEQDEEWLVDHEDFAWRWPWLENKTEILSGEAAMLANPGGTFCYIVWNQWEEEILPDGHELIFNSDMPFRRLMYLSDTSIVETAPTASILYVSATTLSQLDGDILTLAGSARDLDKVGGGIVAYKWTSNLDGEVGNDQVLTIPAADLSRGRHTFTFTALDDEGQWSRAVTVNVTVAEQIYRVMLPMVMNGK